MMTTLSNPITVMIDSAENKSKQAMARWIVKHPELSKQFFFVDKPIFVNGVKAGDIAGNKRVIELKIGADAWSSQVSNHLLDQQQRLADTDFIPHIYFIDDPYRANAINLHQYKWLMRYCQAYGIWGHHKTNLDDAFHEIMLLIRDGEVERFKLNKLRPFVRGPQVKNPLAEALCHMIDGVSIELAHKLVLPTWTTVKDLLEHTQASIAGIVTNHYNGKNMRALILKICARLGI